MKRPETRRPARSARSGFTLIEILVAMMVFLAGITGVLALFSTGLAMHRDGLSVAEGTRALDEVARRIADEVQAGRNWDASGGRWRAIEAAQLPSGSWWSAHFTGEQGRERKGTLLVQVRLASTRDGLFTARPVPIVVEPAPDRGQAIARYRAFHER